MKKINTSERINLKIPLGYRIIKRTKTVLPKEACRLLLSKKQKHLTSAQMIGTKALLTWHSLNCPWCGKEIPSYPHYFRRDEKPCLRKSSERLMEWACMQISLFDNSPSTLNIQRPEYYTKEHLCPRCLNTSLPFEKELDIVIGMEEEKVFVSRQFNDLKEITKIKWCPDITLRCNLSVYERIVFDFKSRRAYIQIIEGDNVYKSMDLENNLSSLGVLQTLICENSLVKRTLKRFFSKVWQEPIPFSKKELCLEKFIALTRFTNFPKQFYQAIPYSKHSKEIDQSFNKAVSLLPNSSGAMEALKKSSLPKTKTIRKAFIKNPGLFFYLEECSFLFEIIKDINFFCSLINSTSVYYLVSVIHSFPGVLSFYKDFCKVKGAKSLCFHLTKKPKSLNAEALVYCALSSYGKKEEQERWKKIKEFFEPRFFPLDPQPTFSIPMHPIPQHIKDCVIDDFCFKWLRTKADYQSAGRTLKNCLTHWSCMDNPVVVVYERKKLVAALEIEEDMVLQALESHNARIDKTSLLYCAIKKWCHKYSLLLAPDI